MEGLIPLVYKTLKKNKTRRQYECLSSKSAAAQNYNISDFYADGYSYQYVTPPPPEKHTSSINGDGDGDGDLSHHHRRHKSYNGDYSIGFSAPEVMVKPKQKQLVRFRSHRFFSCVTGA